MKNNSEHPTTPSGLFSTRLRFCAANSPFISPLRVFPSPFLTDTCVFDMSPANEDLNHFQLQEDNPPEFTLNEVDENAAEQEEESVLNQRVPTGDTISINETNVLDFILHYIDIDERAIERASKQLQSQQFLYRVFEHLLGKFRKLRKTKEEMVKYCVRKSFKFITNRMRAERKAEYASKENNEVVAEYFEIHCEGDTSISMPFKKNSQEKTMNANFLKKIFKCRQYNIDYQEFLESFPQEFNSDNEKKIKALNEVIKKCVKNRNLKALSEFKRLPWTDHILKNIHSFSLKLLENSPHSQQHLNELKKKHEKPKLKYEPKDKSMTTRPQATLRKESCDQFEIIKNAPKKSIIMVSPPLRPIDDVMELSEQPMIQ